MECLEQVNRFRGFEFSEIKVADETKNNHSVNIYHYLFYNVGTTDTS